MAQLCCGINGNVNWARFELGLSWKTSSCITSPRNIGTLCEQWSAVKQEGTMAEYTQEFVEKITVLEKVPEFIMLGSYVNGLKEHIKTELRFFDVTTLKKAM